MLTDDILKTVKITLIIDQAIVSKFAEILLS